MINKKQASDFIVWVEEEAKMAGVSIKSAVVENSVGPGADIDPHRAIISFHGKIPLDKLWRFARGRKADVDVTHEGNLMLAVI